MKLLLRRFRGLPIRMRVVLGTALLLFLAFLYRTFRWSLRMPVRKRTTEQPIDNERPKAVPEEALDGERPIQLTDDGTGELFHRRYRADIANTTRSAEELMALIMNDPNDFSPVTLARFEKTRGQEGELYVGDEYYIHIAGPWDGPVRTIDVQPTSFTFVTLEGHMEAGEIRFRFLPHPSWSDGLRFEILSWARSRDMLVDLAYDKLKVAQEAQTNVWVHFCRRVVEESEGELIDKIDVATEKQPFRGEVIPRE